MSEDSSQTPAPTPAAEDLSRVATAPSATELAPVDSTQQPTTPPQQANADLQPEKLPDGTTGDAVDTSPPPVEEDYETEKARYLDNLKNPKPAPAPAAPVETPVSAPPPPAPAPAETADDLSDINNTVEADGKLSPIRIRPGNAAERQTMAEWKASQKAGNTQTFSEFILARHAPPAQASGESDATNPPPADDTPKTEFNSIEEVRAEIARLTELEYDRQGAFDLDGAKKFREAANDLMMRVPDFQAQAGHAATAAAQAHQQAWNASLAKATPLFPDAGKQGTALEAAAAQVRQEWIASNHPLAHSADSALALYAEAASRIQATPVSTRSPAPVSTPSPVHRPPLSPFIGGGDGRTTQTPPAPDISQTPLSDYESEKEAYLKRSNGARRPVLVH